MQSLIADFYKIYSVIVNIYVLNGQLWRVFLSHVVWQFLRQLLYVQLLMMKTYFDCNYS